MPEQNILIRNADLIVTMNESRTILENASLLIAGNKIKECPSQATTADLVVDGSGKIVFPGFINTHHHFFQTASRFVPSMQHAPLWQWVRILGEISKGYTADDWYHSSITSMAELLLSGCTTTSDHCYLIPGGRNEFFDEEIRAACDIGMRFHPVRGSLTLSGAGAMPPFICQDVDTVLCEVQRVIDKYHDPSFDSMCRIAAGPCFPVFPVSSEPRELSEIMKLCRSAGIRMHTHAAEEIDEFDYCVEKFGKTPIQYLDNLEALGADVWLAHCIFLTDSDIQRMSSTKTCIASCPSANSRGAGIARITECLDAGISVGVGVDGAAGNDTSNILSELRMLRTLQGAREGVLASYLINHKDSLRQEFSRDFKGMSYLNIHRLLEIATIYGAQSLGRQSEIGSLEPGKLADLVLFDDHAISHAGAVSRVGTIFSCVPLRAWCSIINGRIVVSQGQLVTAVEEDIVQNQKETTAKLCREISVEASLI